MNIERVIQKIRIKRDRERQGEREIEGIQGNRIRTSEKHYIYKNTIRLRKIK